ncbi:hypothetical protein GDO81_020940 [Engystomops pustulosus]|uniref:Uncharacterized protein n=1 Tax=Engystomops pustulosus TaxID=76066 RepID=A0AAV6YQR8_ENGPU|nr:hypothetical protein GDO81_021127 [Engystomops pustulosus]KAG8539419.1 hypothetical protein GDO81_020940 [Engystomops pustulosus]
MMPSSLDSIYSISTHASYLLYCCNQWLRKVFLT